MSQPIHIRRDRFPVPPPEQIAGRTEYLRQLVGALQTFADAAWQALSELQERRTSLVTGVAFTAGASKRVAHKLRRVPAGWRVVRAVGANPGLYEVTSSPPDSEFVLLTATTTATADLEFF